MKENYISLLSLVIGWNILSYWTGIHWIGYTALIIGFIGIVSETFTNRLIAIIHNIFKWIFHLLQKIILTMIYFLIVTPIALVKRKDKKNNSTWIIPVEKSTHQFEKMW